MTKLTRRRDKEAAREKWSILYRDVVVGSIGLRKGVPNHADQWEWKCGFYPGSDRSTGGPAATFDDRRAGFEAAWGALLPTLTEADFQAWRDHRDWIARKQAMWDRGEKLPSQQPSSLMRCPCGATFDSHRPAESQIHTPHHLRCAKARRNSTMKMKEDRRWADPEEAARRIMEHARAFEPIRDRPDLYRKDQLSDDLPGQGDVG